MEPFPQKFRIGGALVPYKVNISVAAVVEHAHGSE
jgi:hypothetical protein